MVADHGIGGLPVVVVLYGPMVGAAIGVVVGHRPRNIAAAASGGVLVGLLGWLVWSLTLDPVLHAHAPTWSLVAAATSYPELVADLLHGGLTGLLLQAILAVRWSALGCGTTRSHRRHAGS
jgi:NADH dehydrogenase